MAVDKNKIVAEATRLVQKGSLDKAIATYQKILAEDPKDVRVLLKVGELYQKKSDPKLAADAFTRVAETYAEQGFFLKAVAVYKQIVKLDPEDLRVNERLAALYQQLGLMSDAMAQLQLLAAGQEKAGDGAKLLDVLKRMVELDPDNIASSIKLGELQARAGQPGPALECFKRAAAYLKKNNRADEYLRVAERIAVLQPDDLSLTRELANIYLAKGDTKRALAKLQACFKADPKHVETLQLLAQAFRDLGQTSKTLSVYKELAQVLGESGRAAEARSTWRKVQELAPDDEDALAALGPASAPARPAVPPAAGPPPGAARAAPPTPPRPAPPPAAAPPLPAPGGPDAIPKLLTETDVYVKYGLHDKALDHLRKVLAIDPESAEALERVREIHVAAGRPDEAGKAGALAVKGHLAKGRAEKAQEALARLRQIAPRHPSLEDLAAAVGGTEEVRLAPDELEEVDELSLDGAPPEGDEDALALAAAGAQGEEVVEDEGPAAAAEGEPDLLEELPPGPRRAPDGDALAEEAAIASAAAEEVVDEPVFAEPPPAPPAPARRAPAALVTPPPPAAPARARAAPPPEPEEEAADLSDELDEADFFLQQGLLDEAREALSNLKAFYPGHPGVEARLSELERRSSPARRPAAPPALAGPVRETPSLVAAGGGDESFDIARELAEELGGGAPEPAEDEFQYSVEDVFNQFKKGVEQTVKPEDSATHYDLGIAYKEMGLLDDAIHEFETALRGNDRKKEVDCLSMIGICQVAKGAPREAIQAYRRALSSEHVTKDAAKALHYDLGAAYEAAGDGQAALWFLQKVNKLDPAFRDVARRVQALGGGPGAAPAEPEPRRPTPVPGRAPPRPAAGAKKNIGYL